MRSIAARHSRREFMKRTAAFGALGVAGPSALNMTAISRVAAAEANDYKALVCVFMYGANDNYNTYVPYDIDNHNIYSGARPYLATSRDSLVNTVLTPQSVLPNGKQFALASEMTDLHQLWLNKKMGVLLNVGPLSQPTTKLQYTNKSVPIPPKIFSHNDQQSIWQSLEEEGSTTGWGGRMADIFLSGDPLVDIFSGVSVTGSSVFLSGEAVVPYQVSPEGSIKLVTNAQRAYGSAAVSDAVWKIMSGQIPATGDVNLLKQAHIDVVKRSISADEILTSVLNNSSVSTQFGDGPLSSQLSMVSKLIAARGSLGVKRQVFFVGLSGFDVHDSQLEDHPRLLSEVSRSLSEFYQATEELGVSDQVTTFTASDFGRTLSSNGDGTDHGWGSHHMMIGGAVNGGEFYGTAPELGNNGVDDVGRGRLLPTTSVAQMAATLGTWFGCSESEIVDILPSIVEYSDRNLSFMNNEI